MKKFICGLVAGTVLTSLVGAYAVSEIYENPYPIYVNGEQKEIQGYNIDGYSYFKLRDIAEATGKFDVDFWNDNVQISQDGYVYNNTAPETVNINDLITNYIDTSRTVTNYDGTQEEYTYRLPQLNIQSSDAETINKDIDNRFGSLAKKDLEYYEAGFALDIYKTDYEAALNNDILSLMVNAKATYNDVEYYEGYSIDIKTGKIVSNSDLVAMSGHTEQDFLDYLYSVMQPYYEQYYLNGVWRDWMESPKNMFYSEEYFSIDIPMYVNQYGDIVVAVGLVSPGGVTYQVFNTLWNIGPAV